ncbi:MAG: hypothetical protein NZL96_03700 [Patescibacteria group bacterium]|nr:hypothetical protein [Patescibacteria group bacterium]
MNYTPIDDLLVKYKANNKDELVSKSTLSTKESEPINLEKVVEIKEVVESEVEKEVRPYLQPRKEIIHLPPDLKKLGLQEVNSTIFPSYRNVKLPISDEKVIVGLKAPVTSSLRWLATLAMYLLARARLTLKVIGGRVVRVIRE